MDQGPVKLPPRPRWRLRDVADLARAVLAMWAVAIVITAMVAGIWAAVADEGFREVLMPASLVVAALLAMFEVTSRMVDASTKGWTDSATIGRVGSFLGDRDVGGLTSVGIFLFVSVPLAVAGTLLGS